MLPLGVYYVGLALSAVSAKYTKLDQEFVKPSPDRRDYLGITLDNGLRAVVVSDPSAVKAYIALNVLAGTFHDPQGTPGIASLLAQSIQHCYASQVNRQPASSAVSQEPLIVEVGFDRTIFKLDLPQKASQEAFLSLFKCFANEKRILKSAQELVKESSNKDEAKDDWQNVQAVILEEWNKKPSANYYIIQKELVSYFRTNYVASETKMVVVGNQNTEDLASSINKGFPAVRKHKPTKAIRECSLPGHMGIAIGVKGEVDTMHLQVALPSQNNLSLTKHLEFVEFMLLRTANLTFLNTLFTKNWITDFSVDPAKQGACSNVYLATITFHLTQEGLKNTEAITGLFFKCIDLIRKEGVNEIYFNEAKYFAHRYFKYPSRKLRVFIDNDYYITISEVPGKPLSETLVESLGSKCPFHLAWECASGLGSFNSTAILELLDYFVPQKMRQIIVSNATTNPRKFKIPDSTVGINLSLPPKRKFYPSSYDNTPFIRDTNVSLVFKEPSGILWHSYGDNPSEDVTIRILFAPALDPITQQSEAKMDILAYYYRDKLGPINILLNAADSSIRAEPFTRGLEFIVTGNRNNIFKILEEFQSTLKEHAFNQENFETAKKSALEAQEHPPNHKVLEHLVRLAMSPLADEEFAPIHLIDATTNTSFEEMEEFHEILFSASHVEVFCLGDANVTSLETLVRKFLPKKTPKNTQLTNLNRVTKLSQPSSYVYPMVSKYPEFDSTFTVVYLETYALTKTNSRFMTLALSSLMNSMLLPSLHEFKNAIIYSLPLSFRGGIAIVIPSSYDPIYIEDLIEKKLTEYQTELNQLSSKELQGKLADIKENFGFTDLNHYWESIRSRLYDFGWETEYFKFLSSVTKSELVGFIAERVVHGAPKRVKFSSQITPVNRSHILPTPDGISLDINLLGDVITDGFAWRSQQGFWDFPRSLINKTILSSN